MKRLEPVHYLIIEYLLDMIPLTLMRVSAELYDMIVPTLYRDVKLTQSNIASFFYGLVDTPPSRMKHHSKLAALRTVVTLAIDDGSTANALVRELCTWGRSMTCRRQWLQTRNYVLFTSLQHLKLQWFASRGLMLDQTRRDLGGSPPYWPTWREGFDGFYDDEALIWEDEHAENGEDKIADQDTDLYEYSDLSVCLIRWRPFLAAIEIYIDPKSICIVWPDDGHEGSSFDEGETLIDEAQTVIVDLVGHLGLRRLEKLGIHVIYHDLPNFEQSEAPGIQHYTFISLQDKVAQVVQRLVDQGQRVIGPRNKFIDVEFVFNSVSYRSEPIEDEQFIDLAWEFFGKGQLIGAAHPNNRGSEGDENGEGIFPRLRLGFAMQGFPQQDLDRAINISAKAYHQELLDEGVDRAQIIRSAEKYKRYGESWRAVPFGERACLCQSPIDWKELDWERRTAGRQRAQEKYKEWDWNVDSLRPRTMRDPPQDNI
ncbi:hypothetical protein IAU59_001182 [Kwoniella sp. CBS 9459]